MAPGLLFVYTDVGDGPVPEAEYHDWYDHEHGPSPTSVYTNSSPGAMTHDAKRPRPRGTIPRGLDP